MQRNERFSVLVTNEAEVEKKWTVLKKKVRTVGVHVGLVILCITYMVGGAWLFYSLERPVELIIREKTINDLAYEKLYLLNNAIKLASYYEDFGAFNNSFLALLDDYESFLFEVFSNPISASIFENEIDDLWTSSSAILFTATTLVPVGYGIVAPVTSSGRCCLIVYAIFGIPLALATMANLGKFVCAYLLKFLKKESIVMASITFISLLILYPLFGSLIICIVSSLSWLDSLYFCVMTIFMIGYGDMGPPIPTIFLVIFIVIGVMLVTISVDVVGANIIHHIHFMGRQMGKARIVAEKMVQIAQKISINKGLGLGMAQLGAFARLGALMRFDQTNNLGTDQSGNQPIIHQLKLTAEGVETSNCASKSMMLAFKPQIDDLDFVDKNMEWSYWMSKFVNMNTWSETSSMFCGVPSPNRSINDLSESDSTGVPRDYSDNATNYDRFSSTDSNSISKKISECSSMCKNISVLSSCNRGDISLDVPIEESQSNNDMSVDLTITEKMARLHLDASHHEDSFVANVVPMLETVDAMDPDLELATNELSFNISEEIDRIYRRICEEAAKSSTTATRTETQTSMEINKDRTVITSSHISGKRSFTPSASTHSRSNKLSGSTTVSEFAPAVMSTPYYKRDDDSLDDLSEFTFQPWKKETSKSDSDSSGYGGRNNSALSDDSSTLNDPSKRLQRHERIEECSLSSSLIEEEVRLAYANRITNSTIYFEPNSLSITNNHGNDSTRCNTLSTPGTLLSKTKEQQSVEDAERRGRFTPTRTSSNVSPLTDTGSFYHNIERHSRSTNYHSISTSNVSVYMNGKPNVDPFVRYMNEKKRTINAINEIPEMEEVDEVHESAAITQDSIRTQVGSYLHSCGWLRRRVEHNSRSTSILSHTNVDLNEKDWKDSSHNTTFKTTTLHGNSDLARESSSSLYQPRLMRSFSQSNISEQRIISSDKTKFGSANNEGSVLLDLQSIGDHSKIGEDASFTSNSIRKSGSTRRRSKSCRVCVNDRLSDYSNTESPPKMLDMTRNGMSDGSQFEYDIAMDNNKMHQPSKKLSEWEWRNGKYFSEKWERFVSRKLLFDISRNFDELDDADYDIFIPDEVLENANPEQLLQNRQAVKKAVRHISDDPKMAQILLDYSGDINDVSAARRHYSEAINDDTAFADLTKSFSSALDHFLSFSNLPSNEEYQSLTEEPKPAEVKHGRPRKNRKKTPI